MKTAAVFLALLLLTPVATADDGDVRAYGLESASQTAGPITATGEIFNLSFPDYPRHGFEVHDYRLIFDITISTLVVLGSDGSWTFNASLNEQQFGLPCSTEQQTHAPGGFLNDDLAAYHTQLFYCRIDNPGALSGINIHTLTVDAVRNGNPDDLESVTVSVRVQRIDELSPMENQLLEFVQVFGLPIIAALLTLAATRERYTASTVLLRGTAIVAMLTATTTLPTDFEYLRFVYVAFTLYIAAQMAITALENRQYQREMED